MRNAFKKMILTAVLVFGTLVVLPTTAEAKTKTLTYNITKTSHTSNGNCSLKIQQYRQSDNKLSPCSRSG